MTRRAMHMECPNPRHSSCEKSQTLPKYVLGIDIGTGKVAVAVADPEGNVISTESLPHKAAVAQKNGRAEQDPGKIWKILKESLLSLPEPLLAKVAAVGVTGQMHGVLLLDCTGKPVSNLITWQDGRCLEDPQFLPDANARAKCELRRGLGCATLAWLAQHGEIPSGSAYAGTVHDWVVSRLCGQSRPATDPTDAASWGCFNLTESSWDMSAIGILGIPQSLLPEIRPCGSSAGNLSAESAKLFGLPVGIPVAVAIGDNQASLLATLSDPEHELALTLGTGGQLSAVLPAGAILPAKSAKFECRPYPGGRFAMVAAVLNGGSAWAWLAESAASWRKELGMAECAMDEIYRRLNELGLSSKTEFEVSPFFAGERFDPGLRGGISGLGADGLLLGPLSRGLARGIFTNMRNMIAGEVMAGRTRIVGSGNALRKNGLLRQMAQEVFGLPLYIKESREEAAAGAAILASGLL